MHIKLISAAAAAATLVLLPLAAQAQTVIAMDNAADAAYATGNGYKAGQNGGFGFGAFNVAATGTSAGTFVYSAVNSEGGNGTPPPSSIDSNNVSFGIYANTDATSATTVTRTFNTALSNGDTFALDFVTGYNDGNAAGTNGPGDGSGTSGVALTNGTGTVGDFHYSSGDQYFFDGTAIANQGYTSGALHLLYTLDSPTTYSLQVTGAFQFTGTGTFTGPLSGFQVQQVNSGGGDPGHDAFFNNLVETAPAAVPEASSFVGLGLMLALGGLMVVARKRMAASAS